MKNSDPLFLLIKSLTKSEKRHFKLSMGGFQSKRDKNYMLLFDVFDSLKTYDEKAIRKKLAKIPSFRHLPYLKIYLYEQILKNLRTYYDGQGAQMRLNGYLSDIEILYRKELYADCHELVKKAKRFAAKYEKQAYLLSLIAWEMQLAWNLRDEEQITQLRNKSVEEWQEVVLQSQEINDLRKIYFETLRDMRTWGIARSENEMSRADEILEHPLMAKQSALQQPELARNAIRVHIAHRKGNFEQEYFWIKQRVQIWGEKPHLIKDNLSNYFQNITQQADIGIKLFKFREAEEVLQNLKKICETNSNEISFKRKSDIRIMEVEILSKKGEFGSAAKLLPDLITYMEANLSQLDPLSELVYYYCVFRTYFGNGDFDKAHSYLPRVIHFPHLVIVNLQSQARIINLILQYERKEYTYLGHLLSSTYRFLLKNKRIYQTETIIIDFLRKAFRFTSQKDILTGLAEMKQKVTILRQQRFEQNFLDQFPLLDWIDSKILHKPLAEIIRERYEDAMAKEKESEKSL